MDLSEKDLRILQAHLEGKTNKDIGAIEYSDAKPNSQAVLVSRVLQKTHVAQYLQQSKLEAIKKHGLTWDKVIKPIADALEAERLNQYTGEIQPDHTTRLSASKAARELLAVKDAEPTTPEQLNPIQRELLRIGEAKNKQMIDTEG